MSISEVTPLDYQRSTRLLEDSNGILISKNDARLALKCQEVKSRLFNPSGFIFQSTVCRLHFLARVYV